MQILSEVQRSVCLHEIHRSVCLHGRRPSVSDGAQRTLTEPAAAAEGNSLKVASQCDANTCSSVEGQYGCR